MERDLTLMAVHAHPDDEAIGTGGVLARYADEGIRTVLVTCTNGELGDAPGGIKPDQDGHDEEELVRIRLDELRRACEDLGVGEIELLGYHDSGMMGWPQNDRPGSFWSTPVDDAASRLAALMEQHRPQVVVTYDDNGFYGHPDHIQANRITLRAREMTGIPDKLYYIAIPRSAVRELGQKMRELGIEPPGDVRADTPDDPPFGTPDELVTTVIDCSDVIERKRSALMAHASQIAESSFFSALPEEFFGLVFGREAFVRHFDRTSAPTPEDDLFAGLREPTEPARQ
jgi:LmbE family N-acetylglucosaminyl deacetylase